MCNASRLRIGLTQNEDCPYCVRSLETEEHVLRRCTNSAMIWKSFLPPAVYRCIDGLNFEEWFQLNLMQGSFQ